MPGPLVIIPAGALTIPTTTASTGLIVGGAIATGVGLSWLVSSEASTTARPVMDNITYQDFLKKRLAHYKQTQDLPPKEAMKLIGPEWQQFKADHQTVTSAPSSPIKQSTLKGQSARSLRLEVPYHYDSQPDLAAAWDVAEGLLDFLFSNAAGVTQAEAFRRQAASAYARAKGLSSQGDQNEYELGQNLGQTLLLVMAHRGLTQDTWVEMLPPQIIDASTPSEDKGLIDQGLELLGLDDKESATSKTVQKVMDTVVEKGGQTVMDIIANP